MEILSIDVVENATKTVNIMPETPLDKVVADCMKDYLEMRKSEEQGLFLMLPCKVGDIAWVIDEDFECSGKKKIYEAKWTRVTLVQSETNGLFELHGEVSYQVYDFFYNDGRTMPHAMYVGQHNTKFGEVVFLSKEEAERALKQMGE